MKNNYFPDDINRGLQLAIRIAEREGIYSPKGNQLLENQSEDLRNLIEDGLLSFKTSDKEDSIDYFTDALGIKENEAICLFLRGFAFHDIGQPEKGNEDLILALEVSDFESPISSYAKGILSGKLQGGSSSVEHFTRGSRLEVKVADTDFSSIEFYFQGLCNYVLGDKENALKSLSLSIEMDDEQADALFLRGLIQTQFNRASEAIKDLSEILHINLYPDSAETIFYLRGVAYSELNENELAIKDLNRSIEIDGSNAMSYTFRGLTLLKENQWGNSIADLNKALSIDDSIANAYLYRGIANLLTGDFGLAKRDLEKSIVLDPKSSEAYLKNYQESLLNLSKQDIDNKSSYELIISFLNRLSIFSK